MFPAAGRALRNELWVITFNSGNTPIEMESTLLKLWRRSLVSHIDNCSGDILPVNILIESKIIRLRFTITRLFWKYSNEYGIPNTVEFFSPRRSGIPKSNKIINMSNFHFRKRWNAFGWRKNIVNNTGGIINNCEVQLRRTADPINKTVINNFSWHFKN